MIGLLTEQYAGAFPLWLAPVQIAMLPIADRHAEKAHEIATYLRGFAEGSDLSFRVEVDDRRETLGKKIRENQRLKVPYMLILGDRDIEQGTVGVRHREEGDLGAMSLNDFITRLNSEL